MVKLSLLLKYLLHWFKSHNSKGFGIHSPFIFHLVTEIIHDFTPFYCYSSIEKERKKLLTNQNSINVTDYGSGSLVLKNPEKKISGIAKYSLKSQKHAQLLFRLVNHFESKHILELGTSFGITTSYLASVSSRSTVISLEGCPEISKIANSVFNNLDIKNIEIITGNINETLTPALGKLKSIDFVFFDGNHQKQATLNYFNTCLPFAHNNSVFVIDDIHLNKEMEQAWAEIKDIKEVMVTIDLFHLGIVLFKKEFTRQHFKVKF